MSQQEPVLGKIGKYTILGTLGRGSMGVVYKAQDPEIGRIVAIKVLRSMLIQNEGAAQAALQRFKVEARSAGNLRHAHIITLFEVSNDGDTPFIVMDYIEGEGLDRAIERKGRLSPEETLHYLSQLASGLDYAHSKGVIHRDMKPSNIHLDRNGNAFILDFGVASISGTGGVGGPVMGSPGYMSPEQILNKQLDNRTDLFSFAVIAFECLTGDRPFPGKTFSEVASCILHAPPLSITAMLPGTPLAVEAEFERALAKDREHRLPKAKEFVQALGRAYGIGPGLYERGLTFDSAESLSWTMKDGSDETPTFQPPMARTQGETSGAQFKTTVGGEGGDFVPVVKDESPRELPRVLSSPGPRIGPAGALGNPIPRRAKRAVGKGRGISGGLQDAAGALETTGGDSPLSIRTLLALGSITAGFVLLIFSLLKPVAPPPGPVASSAAGAGGQQESLANLVGDRAAERVRQLSRDDLLALIRNQQAAEDGVLAALIEARGRGILESSLAPLVLGNDSYIVRKEAIRLFVDLHDRTVVPALLPLLDDHDPTVRREAARGLGILSDRRALAYLSQRLRSEELSSVKEEISRSIDLINGYSGPDTEDATKRK